VKAARERLLYIQGEKTGVDMSSGIDVNYRLGKNQISRAILAKLQPKFFSVEARKEYNGFSGSSKRAVIAKVNESLTQEARQKVTNIRQDEGNSFN